jgi:hypothetical protein
MVSFHYSYRWAGFVEYERCDLTRRRGGAEEDAEAQGERQELRAEISGLRSEADAALKGWRERHDEESTSCGWVSGEKERTTNSAADEHG